MTDDKVVQVAVRFPAELLDGIDQRRDQVNLSRNEWIVRCTRWALHNLPLPRDGGDPDMKRAFARSAPSDVAGTDKINMGLDLPEQTRAVIEDQHTWKAQGAGQVCAKCNVRKTAHTSPECKP